jgi:2-C-methyl-D-erythritol 4-phosphate cytidylyltransferase
MEGAAILLAGGSSSRMGSAGKKELMDAGGKPVILRCAETFATLPEIKTLVIVHPEGTEGPFRSITYPPQVKILFVAGGSTRQRSVLAALEALLESSPRIVLIHDGARPFVSEACIRAVWNGAVKHGACLPVIPVVYALKEVDSEGWVDKHVDRSSLSVAQTPQGFYYPGILQSHRQALVFSDRFSDDSEIWSRYVGKVWSVPGEPGNIKITYPSDRTVAG